MTLMEYCGEISYETSLRTGFLGWFGYARAGLMSWPKPIGLETLRMDSG